MKLFHRHQWEDVNKVQFWRYDYIQEERNYWTEDDIYESENPGPRKLLINGNFYNKQFPRPHITITQKCPCGRYRDQTVEGVL